MARYRDRLSRAAWMGEILVMGGFLLGASGRAGEWGGVLAETRRWSSGFPSHGTLGSPSTSSCSSSSSSFSSSFSVAFFPLFLLFLQDSW